MQRSTAVRLPGTYYPHLALADRLLVPVISCNFTQIATFFIGTNSVGISLNDLLHEATYNRHFVPVVTGGYATSASCLTRYAKGANFRAHTINVALDSVCLSVSTTSRIVYSRDIEQLIVRMFY